MAAMTDTRNTNEERGPGRWVSEALLVAGFTVLSYAVAFAYESGYAAHFRIPREFITVSTSRMLLVAGPLCMWFITVFLLANVCSMLAPKSVGPVSFAVWRFLLFFFVPLIVVILPFWRHWEVWAVCFGVFLFVAFFEFVWPLITQRVKGSYAEKLVSQELLEQHVRRRSLLGILLNSKYGRWVVITSAGVYVAITIAVGAGFRRAESRRVFHVPDGVSDTAIVAIYDDTVISARFDPDSRELTGSLEIVELADKSPLAIHAEIIGPLKWRSIPTRDGSAKEK